MIGTDILSIKRLERVLLLYPEKLLKRILSQPELKQFQDIQTEKRRLEYLCGRFSAKEAIFKATPSSSSLTWKRISILSELDTGKPLVYIDGKLMKGWMEISISHEEKYVVAVAINLSNLLGNKPE